MSNRGLKALGTLLDNNLAALLFLCVLYAIAVSIVGVGGDFPLNDDWSYAAAARSLAIGHDWRPTDWTSATLLTQSLWGSLFCFSNKCSYVDFRFSSLCAAGMMLPLGYALFRWVGATPWVSALGVVVTLLNPLNFTLQFTFMTEPLFGLLMLASVFTLFKFMDGGAYLYLALGCVILVAATLCRQLALCVPLAFLAVVPFYRNGEDWWKRLIISIVPFLLCAVTLVVFDRWMKATGRTPSLYNAKSDLIISALKKPGYFVQRVSWNTTVFMLYLGFIVAPLAIGRKVPRYAPLAPWGKSLAFAVAGSFGLMFIGILVLRRHLLPISGNILTREGIGPILMYGETPTSPPPLPMFVKGLLTVTGVAGAVLLIFMSVVFILSVVTDLSREMKERRTLLGLVSLVTIAAYFAPLSSITFYDRYIMPMIPVACLLVILVSTPPKSSGWLRWLGPAVGCLLVGFSVLAVHDYLSWNRARWQALALLEGPLHQSAHDIDGGFEYNGSRLYDPNYVPTKDKSSWWVDKDTYQVTLNTIAGEQVVARVAYPVLLPPGTRYVYVLKGNGGAGMAMGSLDAAAEAQP